ncbi:helix-turn-helix transcriptional regulator [Streptomyces sp. MI02-7b]|uniref:helix-turn-helix transcriptional regulator n=1 Tax=Streptomyces sp. MI02-7b TaxID=462941 RepID=UPI0029A19520|nr:LuxR C-terminal-related transcriptional regulator [Streptomyces sp. MI02-7b]MDX3078609.1 LuxR C-terminal-related transcriptional regulator [Streptomyces sp. MI02-7b]
MLEVLGLDQLAEALYLILVDNPPLSLRELCRRTDRGSDEVLVALAKLEDGGLISRVPGPSASFTALSPDHAMEALLLARERDIRRVRAMTEQLTARHREARRSRESAELIQVVTGCENVARFGQQLFARAQREIRGIDAPPYARSSDGELVDSVAAVTQRGLRSRFIRARDTLALPEAARRMEFDVAAGEEVRILPTVPMKMVIADDQAALIPLQTNPKVMDACILVHPSALLDALSALFESLWNEGQPYLSWGERTDDLMSDEERRIISLLAAGFSDEAIARQLDLGYRTVQRRVQALLGQLGAVSRFQAGVLAANRGWWQPSSEGEGVGVPVDAGPTH